jgi:hypothetical protein
MGIAIIAAAAACYIGWHVSRAHMAHRGLPVRRGQLRALRTDRTRHAVWIAGMVLVLLFVFAVLAVH